MKTPKFAKRQITVAKAGTQTPGWWPLAIFLFGIVLFGTLIWQAFQPENPPTVLGTPQPIASTAAPTPTSSSTPEPSLTSGSATPSASLPDTGQTTLVNDASGQAQKVPVNAANLGQTAIQSSVSDEANKALPWESGFPIATVPGFVSGQVDFSPMFLSGPPSIDQFTFNATLTDKNNPNKTTEVSRTVIFQNGQWLVSSKQ